MNSYIDRRQLLLSVLAKIISDAVTPQRVQLASKLHAQLCKEMIGPLPKAKRWMPPTDTNHLPEDTVSVLSVRAQQLEPELIERYRQILCNQMEENGQHSFTVKEAAKWWDMTAHYSRAYLQHFTATGFLVRRKGRGSEGQVEHHFSLKENL